MRRIALFGSLFLIACAGGDTHSARAFLTVSPDRLTFGHDSATQVLTIRNEGTATLAVSGVDVVGVTSGAAFTADPRPFEVPAGTTHDLEVGYTPSPGANDAATLRIHSNADNAPERDVPLSGLGRAESPDAGTTEDVDAGTTEDVDAGTTEDVDAGTTGTPDAGTTGTPDAGTTGTPDAGTPVNPGTCELELGTPVEAGRVAGSISDLTIAAGPAGATIGWWTDARDLGVRTLSADGAPTGAARVVYHAPDSRFPVESVAGAADATGAVFFVSEETAFNEKVHRVDLHGGAPSGAEFDIATDIIAVSAAPSAGGIAALWRKTGAGAGVVALREGGSAPFSLQDTGLPTSNALGHAIAPDGEGLFVAWHGGVSAISGAKLDRLGKLVPGSQKSLSIGGTKNVRAAPVSTAAGLAIAWMQDAGGARNAMVSRLSDALAPLDGDLTLGRIGIAGSTSGSVAAAASGDLALAAWSRFDDVGHPLGLAVGGVDRRTGRLLAVRSLDVPTLSAFTDIALAPAGNVVSLAFSEDDGANRVIRTLTVRCR